MNEFQKCIPPEKKRTNIQIPLARINLNILEALPAF